MCIDKEVSPPFIKGLQPKHIRIVHIAKLFLDENSLLSFLTFGKYVCAITFMVRKINHFI